MSSYWPLLALAAVGGVAALLLVLRDWRVGALLVAVALPFEGLLPRFGASGMKVLAAVALLGLAVHLLHNRALLARLLAQLRSDVSLTLLALVALAALSAAWALSAPAALARALTFAGLFLLLHLFGLLDAPFLRRTWLALLASAALTVPIGLLFDGVGAFSEDGRFAAGGLNPNDYAGLLVVVLFVALSLPASRLLKGLLALAVLAGVFWSGSRTAFVALAIAPLLHLALSPAAARGPALWRGALAYGALAAALLGLYAFDRPQAQAMHARAMTVVDYRDSGTWAGRLEIWRGGLEMFQDAPVLGTGAGNFALAAPTIPGMPQRTSEGGPGPVAHNVFLGLAAELGVVGLAVFAFLLVRAFLRARRAATREALGGGLLLGLIACTLMGLSLSWEYQKVVFLVLGSLLALTAPRRPTEARA